MNKLPHTELKELEKFINKVSSEGFTSAIKSACPDCSHYPVFLPLLTLNENEALDWLEELMKNNNLNYN